MNPKELRIVFMGTPGFAACSLEKLLSEKYNVVAVVTAPDKPSGRGLQMQQSEVKQMAVKYNLPVLQPEKLKSPEFIAELQKFQPELGIVVAFRMLPEVIWSMPKFGTFNLHGSLLPQYRGAAPINRAIMNGEVKTGVTTFLLKQEIDTGNIIFREEVPIGPTETAGGLHDRMMIAGADLVTKTVDAIAQGNVQPRDQQSYVAEGEILKEAPKLFRENTKIDWTANGKAIVDHIRGLNPFPTAWTELVHGEERIPIKVYDAEFQPKNNSGEIGTSNHKLQVNVRDGIVVIKEIQAPGKKRMSSGDFLRGFRINHDLKFV
jgi:methionyl-tRNA formyltransferase